MITTAKTKELKNYVNLKHSNSSANVEKNQANTATDKREK